MDMLCKLVFKHIINTSLKIPNPTRASMELSDMENFHLGATSIVKIGEVRLSGEIGGGGGKF